jgi:hypothetical protein
VNDLETSVKRKIFFLCCESKPGFQILGPATILTQLPNSVIAVVFRLSTYRYNPAKIAKYF